MISDNNFQIIPKLRTRVEKSSLIIVGAVISSGFLVANHMIGFNQDISSYIAVAVVIMFSLFAQVLINAHREAQDRMTEYSNSLEDRVRERTRELSVANDKLSGEIQLRRDTEELLRASESKYRTIFENTGTAILICDEQGRVSLANSQLSSITGYSLEELMSGDNWTCMLEDSQKKRVIKWIYENHSSVSNPRSFEAVLKCRGGQKKSMYITLASFQDQKATMVSLVDITELKKAEQRLFHQAFHDHLTDLPNRSLFMELLNLALRRSRRRPDYLFSVLYLDIDRFKYINDSLGHLFGDRLLIKFAETIKTCLRDSDTVARMGGDEFAVILDDVNELDYTSTVVDRITTTLKQPLNINGHEVYSNVSMGIVTDCRSYENPEDIIRDADAAMYEAKNAGRACFRVFEAKMHHRFKRILELETAMRKALKNGEFVLHYQPIVSMQGGKISSLEALIRWERPGMGLVPPAEFIPVAEETGLILPLGQWVLSRACMQMSQWQKKYPLLADCSVCVNLSGRQFNDSHLEAHIGQVLKDAKLPAHNLKLEITENEVMHNPERAIELLTRLRKLGIKIMVDDFGTGYSSLSYLHRFPIDVLKVDRDFVNRVDTFGPPSDQKIVETIISLAHSLNLEVVAEGVERSTQSDFLSKLNCQFAQGFLYYRPMPPEMIGEEFLERISK